MFFFLIIRNNYILNNNLLNDQFINFIKYFRYNECKDKIMPYLKKLGFNPQKDLTFMPVSGLTGLGLKQAIDPKICPWYR